MKMITKISAAISDTDILLDLYRSNCLELLSYLFSEIHIPEYIYELELKKVAGKDLIGIMKIINDDNGIFKVIYDKDLDIGVKNLKKALKRDREYIAGPGEVECACYAHVTDIRIVVSNNYTEFKYLDDIAIMLSYIHLLTICVNSKILTFEKANEMYDKINNIKNHSSSLSFEQRKRRLENKSIDLKNFYDFIK
jgi:hypothetical protein